MSEYIINNNPEPLGNLGAMVPPGQRMRPESSVPARLQAIPPAPMPPTYGQTSGYVPASLGGSVPLTVGVPEALGAERRLPTFGANSNRAYFHVNPNGQIAIPKQQSNDANQNGRQYNTKMGIPSFGNAGYFG